jgi:hypothetical protein
MLVFGSADAVPAQAQSNAIKMPVRLNMVSSSATRHFRPLARNGSLFLYYERINTLKRATLIASQCMRIVPHTLCCAALDPGSIQ